MPKRKKRDRRVRYAFLAIVLCLAAGGAGAAVYLTSKASSANFSAQIYGAVSPRLNVIDVDFLRDNNLKFTQDKKTNFVRSLSALGQPIPLSKGNLVSDLAVSNQFLKDYARFFGVGDSKQLILHSSKKDELGLSHIKYQQKIGGVPVFGAQMLVHVKEDLSVNSAAGKLLANVSINTNPKITGRAAGDAVKRSWQKSDKAPKVSAGKLYIFNKNLLDARFENKNHLTWEIKAVDADSGFSETYYIDATSGAILQKISNVKQISRRIFNCGNNRNRTTCRNMLGAAASRAQNDRAEGWAAAGVAEVDNVYQMMNQAHNYFQNTFGIDGANGRDGIGDNTDGHPRTSTDVYADWLIPASWGFNCPNSFFFENKLMFCNNTVNLPVVGHEYMHGVAHFNGPPLTYAYESGAIEEANADIFGQALENAVTGSSSWRIGPTGGNLWRNIVNPASLNDPDRFYSNNFYCGDNDEGGVHNNSNVISHAAYLLATGGSFNGCSIDSIGQNRMERIFYRALTVYLTASSDFNDLYDALDNACGDLYSDAICAQVRRALQAAEIDQPGRCSGTAAAPKPTCFPPYILSVSANAGHYRANQSITLRFKFSKPVRTAGAVDVFAVLNGRTAEKICSLDLSSRADDVSCSFKVNDGDSGRLRVDRIEWDVKRPILDADSSELTDMVPAEQFPKGDVIIDTAKPTGSVTINSGAKTTASHIVELALSSNDDKAGLLYRVSNNGVSYSRWDDFAATTSWNLYNADAGGGVFPTTNSGYPRTVYVQFKDQAGNVSDTYSANITFSRLTILIEEPAQLAVPTSSQPNGANLLLNIPPSALTIPGVNVTVTQTSAVVLPQISTTTVNLNPAISSSLIDVVSVPDFTISVKQGGLTTYLSGAINYWGKGAKCEGPRTYDAVVANWGDGASAKPARKDKTFYASHTYAKTFGSYKILVKVYNSCGGSASKSLYVKPQI
ncbi:hypothetical protein EPN28_04365 [Patescibacteria group bacterium]|nr:MAG: hypothetical protein EPN28_04365 [Patescibacteria group bacterium]